MSQQVTTLHTRATAATSPAESPAEPKASQPLIASRRAWVAWMRGQDDVPGKLLLAAVLHEPSRDALLLYPHRGDWHRTDPTRGRTWTLTANELLTLGRNGAPNEDLSTRTLDGLGKVLDEATNNDSQHAAALASQGFLAWDSENNAAALLWTVEALQHDPNNRLATVLDEALRTSRLPLWRR